jgi:hypothetical protein
MSANAHLTIWRGNHDTPLANDVAEAAAYYEKKYGRKATVAYCHPDRADECMIGGVRVEHDWHIFNVDEIFIGALE